MISLRDHETTILHILGTEILGLFQIDLLSNFMLEMTTEHIPALSGSQFCYFLAFRKCLILKYRKFFEKEKVNFVNVIIRWLQSYFMWLIPICQVNFSWTDLVYFWLKNASFGGWVTFQAFSIYLGSHCQNLNFISNFKNLPQMMKNEGSNSLMDIKSTHLKIALLFWNSKVFFILLLGGYNFSSITQIFNLGSGTGIPGRLKTLEKSPNLQTRHFLISNKLGLFIKNLLDI